MAAAVISAYTIARLALEPYGGKVAAASAAAEVQAAAPNDAAATIFAAGAPSLAASAVGPAGPGVMGAAWAGNAAESAASIEPQHWPLAFHAVLMKNRSGVLGRTDLYYDWLGGRNLHIDHRQDQELRFDNERQNGSTYYYTGKEGNDCKVIEMGVGLLPPDWLSGGRYLGVETIENASGQSSLVCNVWEKGEAMGNFTGPFITYYEDAITFSPARWRFFDGMSFDVIDWRPGESASIEDWQIPAACFHTNQESANSSVAPPETVVFV
eukprot:TRINITY_DN76025_c0_g1_i1.p1 TRINITY_DN76025_c0_g1~~TRINITY_DN76025_c0_g1_i1.p1  ORF type:complete len:268 (-),score=38.25 TRINITY_DN76025_c0_g1_i1:303-1106(-)